MRILRRRTIQLILAVSIAGHAVSCVVEEKPPKVKPTVVPKDIIRGTQDERLLDEGPSDPGDPVYLGSDGMMAGRGRDDIPVSRAFRLGQGERSSVLSIEELPKDRYGLIDWVAMVDGGFIEPNGSLDPEKPELAPLDITIHIKAKSKFVKDVPFSHKVHTYWLGCNACHPGIFIMARGQNGMSMEGITQGKWCGRCHGKVAFPLADCIRCHFLDKK